MVPSATAPMKEILGSAHDDGSADGGAQSGDAPLPARLAGEGRMCRAVGVDLVRVVRIEDAVTKFGERFLKRIFTEVELAYCLPSPHGPQRLAGRFAAKEAASKALGTGMVGVGWKDFEITNLPSGQPVLSISGRAGAVAQSLGITRWRVSLAHEREYAVAVVTAE